MSTIDDLETILEEENFHELDPNTDLTWDNLEVDEDANEDAGISDYD